MVIAPRFAFTCVKAYALWDAEKKWRHAEHAISTDPTHCPRVGARKPLVNCYILDDGYNRAEYTVYRFRPRPNVAPAVFYDERARGAVLYDGARNDIDYDDARDIGDYERGGDSDDDDDGSDHGQSADYDDVSIDADTAFVYEHYHSTRDDCTPPVYEVTAEFGGATFVACGKYDPFNCVSVRLEVYDSEYTAEMYEDLWDEIQEDEVNNAYTRFGWISADVMDMTRDYTINVRFQGETYMIKASRQTSNEDPERARVDDEYTAAVRADVHEYLEGQFAALLAYLLSENLNFCDFCPGLFEL
jgi:hypothetical protein